jgi:GNAT superfamily N-acetyltransferase
MSAVSVTPEMVHQLEQTEARHLERQVEACTRLRPDLGARVMSVAGGIAAFTAREYGRKLNHATGCGLDVALSEHELTAMEKAYAKLGLAPEIDLCPFVNRDVLQLLASRGYAANASSNTYAKVLDHLPLESRANPSIEIEVLNAANRESFFAASVAGFSTEEHRRPAVLLQVLAQIAMIRDDTRLYLARVNGQIAGTAGLALIDLPDIAAAYLYIASTLLAYRGRGVQLALIQARLADAKRAGAKIASITARPAGASSRNALRAGFELAYTKSTFAPRHMGQ